MEIPDTHKVMLYKMLYDVTKILTDCNISYWIDGGTMLGAVRHQSLIPWDDDVDLGVKAHDYLKMLKIQKKFIDAGYSIQNDVEIFKVFIPNEWVEYNNKIIGTPTLDFFRYSLHGNYYTLHDLSLRKRWPFAKHYKSDLFPLKKVKFGELTVNCPKNPNGYLDGTYPNWLSRMVVDLRDAENPLNKYSIG